MRNQCAPGMRYMSVSVAPVPSLETWASFRSVPSGSSQRTLVSVAPATSSRHSWASPTVVTTK